MDCVLLSAVLCLCLGSCNALAVHVTAEPRAREHLEGETVWIVCSVNPSDSTADRTQAENDSNVSAHKTQSQSILNGKTKLETLSNFQANSVNNATNATPAERRRPPSEHGDLETLIGESPPTERKGDATKSHAVALQLKPTLVKSRIRRARPREKAPNTKIHNKPPVAETLDNSTVDDKNLETTKLIEFSKQHKQWKPVNKPADVSNVTQYSASRTASAVGVRKKMPETRTKSLTLSYKSRQLNQTSSQAKKVEQGARPGPPKLPTKNSRLTKFEKTPRLSQPKKTTLIANQHRNQTKANNDKPQHKGPVKTVEHSTETQTQKIVQVKTNKKPSLPVKSTQAPAVIVKNQTVTSQHEPDQHETSSRLTTDHNNPVNRISSSGESTESLATDTSHQNSSGLDVRNPVRSRATQRVLKPNKSQEQRYELAKRPGHKVTAQAHSTLKTPLQYPPLEVTLDETDVKDKRQYESTEEMHILTETTDNMLDLVERTHDSQRQTTTFENVSTKVKAADTNPGRLNEAENSTKSGQVKPKPAAHPDKRQPGRQVPDRKGSEHKRPPIKTPGHQTPLKPITPTETHQKPTVVPSTTTFTTTQDTATTPEHASPAHATSKKLEISNPGTARPVDRSNELVVQWLLAGVDGSEVEIARRDRRGKLKVAEEFRERQRTGGLDLKWDSAHLALSLGLSPAVRADTATYRCVAMHGWDDGVLNASAEVQLKVLRPDSNIYPHQEAPSTKGPSSIEEAVLNEGLSKSISQELYILTVAVCCLGLISLLLFLSVILHRHRTRKHRSMSAAPRSLQDCKCSIGRSHSRVNGCMASDHRACTNSAKVIKTLQEKFAEKRVSVTCSSVCTPPESSTAHSADQPPEPQLISAEELVPCDVTYAALDLSRPVCAKPQPLPRTIYAQISFSQSKNG